MADTKASELEKTLSTALQSLYKMTYYYFRKSANASVELQAKRAVAICNLLDVINKEFSSIGAAAKGEPEEPVAPSNPS